MTGYRTSTPGKLTCHRIATRPAGPLNRKDHPVPRPAPEPIRLPDAIWHQPATLRLCRDRDANGLLHLARKYGGMTTGRAVTNEALAHWTDISPGEISRRLNGHNTSPVLALHRWQHLADGLNMPDHARALIGLAPGRVSVEPERAGADTMGEDVERREMLRLLAVAGGTAVVSGMGGSPWDRLAAALRGDDPGSRDELAMRTAGLFGLEERVPAAALQPIVASHLDALSARIRRSTGDRKTVVLAGETAALGGWLAFDLNDPATAQAYYRVALAAADESGDPALRACVLGYMSYQTQPAGTSPVGLLAQARESASESGTPMSRAWLAARHAEEQVRTGDGRGALASLDDARRLHALAVSGDRAWTHFFDTARLTGMAAASYVRLGRATDAEECADAAVKALGPANVKRRSLVLVDLASANLARGNVEEACRYASESLASAVHSGHQYGVGRVRELRTAMVRYADSGAVQDLDAQLAALA